MRANASRLKVKVPWYSSPWQIAARAVSAALTVAVVGLVVAVAVIPQVAGGASLTVLTSSMEPALSPGDVVAVRGIEPSAVCSDVGIGEVVTYFPEPGDPALITHRVVGKSFGAFDDGTPCRLVTQGDAVGVTDDPVSPAQVRGVLLYKVPWLGYARAWTADHISLAIAVTVLALGTYLVVATFRRPRTRVFEVPTSALGATAVAASGLQDAALQAREAVLRERELAIQQRETALANAELPTPTAPTFWDDPGA
ncbi:signal peptidase I [Xylanimonas ulmi]|uniref:Signal peptidase I n=1 Tax=Xylanimonas ulmi TaxID=228973 RepID=A0A4Q7M4S9_9MICO|nr:signal peptidase I [Xylanibacterium ulmi]RZS62023.1 signal peptidase [Xylanibacterium ulmi]